MNKLVSSGNSDPEKRLQVFIGQKEWDNYSYEDKLRLLYLLQQSNTSLANSLKEPIENLVEKERKENEIDLKKTFETCYKDEGAIWQD